MTSDPTIVVRPAAPQDLAAMAALERQSPFAAHWTDTQYRNLFVPGASERLILIAEHRDTAILGFLVAHHVATEWELENIVISAQQRRTGLGTRLLTSLLVHVRQTSAHSLFLEVRESNLPARAFYESAGFQQNGRRKAYYHDPAEDALLYTLAVA